MKKEMLLRKKICLLGSFGVGKTSLVRSFVYNKFEEKYLSTIGVHICHKAITIPASNAICTMNLILWDLAHIEKINEMTRNYFRGASGAIVVFDVTRRQNVKESEFYLTPFLELNPRARLIFVANKIDLVSKDQIEMEQLLQLGNTYHAPLILTSARTGENVELLFSRLGAQLIEAS
ncbi:GTP-binding protein [candidate division KSB1 bacterium]|nr:GTP-binding protein [candidate division KSB1 bacterium]